MKKLALFFLLGMNIGAWAAPLPLLRNPYTTNSILPQYHAITYGAFPNDGRDDVVAIQAAYDAASLAGGGVVILGEGQYDLNPNNLVHPTWTTEGHPNVICMKSNNVSLVGAGMNATKLKVSTTYSGGVVNVIGAGKLASHEGVALGITNVMFAGFEVDAGGYNMEAVQFGSIDHWYIRDVRLKGAGNAALNYDAWDIQYEGRVWLFNIEATDCGGNGFGAGGSEVYVDGLMIARCGLYGGTGGAIQCAFNPPPQIHNLTIRDCPTIMSDDSFLDVDGGLFVITNTLAGITNFDIGTSYVMKMKNVEIRNATTANGQMFFIRGGSLIADNLIIDNTMPGILMASGEAVLSNSKLGTFGAQRPLVTQGGALRISNCEITGNTSQRDIRIESGTTSATIRNSRFLGSVGVTLEASGYEFTGNITSGPLYIGASGTIRGNVIGGSGDSIVGAGSPLFIDNVFNASYRRDGGSPTFLGNVWTSMSDATRNELQESLPTRTAITPAATQTLWTNNTPYTVEVHWFGGTATGFGRNGQQHGTGAGSLTLQCGSWVGITNSGTPEIYYSATR